MKHATVKYFCLLVTAFAVSKAGAQGFKIPPLYKPTPKSTILESYKSDNLKPIYRGTSSIAILLNVQKNFTAYALPLDGTPCLVANEPADKNMNAWKPESNAGFTITIPNALEIRDILPQKTAPFSLLEK